MKRSGGFEAEIYGNYNTLGWLLITNDNNWLVTGNYGDETNDFYSIAYHEIGHALQFNPAHPGFTTAKGNGGFTSPAVTNYYGDIVPIDNFDHLNGVIDPDSRQGAFGYEYYGDILRKRWLITKLDLLCAQEVGYSLRPNAALEDLFLPALDPIGAKVGVPFSVTYKAFGGIPIYTWDIVDGNLPPGLSLDRSKGSVTGTPTQAGSFDFTLRVRDYHEGAIGIARPTAIAVLPAPTAQLTVTLLTVNQQKSVQLTVDGPPGQAQEIQISIDLSHWISLETVTPGTTPVSVVDTDPVNDLPRFYRAIPR